MVQCCAKLHNVCVNRWIINGKNNNFESSSRFEDIPEHVNIDSIVRPTDAEVADRLNNRYVDIGLRAAQCDLRVSMMNMIWNTGLRITCDHDLVGLPVIEAEADV